MSKPLDIYDYYKIVNNFYLDGTLNEAKLRAHLIKLMDYVLAMDKFDEYKINYDNNIIYEINNIDISLEKIKDAYADHFRKVLDDIQYLVQNIDNNTHRLILLQKGKIGNSERFRFTKRDYEIHHIYCNRFCFQSNIEEIINILCLIDNLDDMIDMRRKRLL